MLDIDFLLRRRRRGDAQTLESREVYTMLENI